MDAQDEPAIRKFLKIIFTVIAVISLVLVAYNIGIYTNNQSAEVLADIK